MLIHCTIKTPGLERRRGPYSRPLGWPLTPEQFLEVDPFPLWLRQQSSACLCPEVPNDDTRFRNKKWGSQANE
jgi:hypothetical protein